MDGSVAELRTSEGEGTCGVWVDDKPPHGPLFIDENFASFRNPGQAIGLHAGGYDASKKRQYRVRNGIFMRGHRAQHPTRTRSR